MHIVFIWMNSSSQNYFCAKYNGGEISEQNLTWQPDQAPLAHYTILRQGTGQAWDGETR